MESATCFDGVYELEMFLKNKLRELRNKKSAFFAAGKDTKTLEEYIKVVELVLALDYFDSRYYYSYRNTSLLVEDVKKRRRELDNFMIQNEKQVDVLKSIIRRYEYQMDKMDYQIYDESQEYKGSLLQAIKAIRHKIETIRLENELYTKEREVLWKLLGIIARREVFFRSVI